MNGEMVMDKTTLTKPTDRELVFTRVFDAPRELLFEVWTDPKHLEKWWGPNGFRTETFSIDVRVGGEWRHVMHGPDGRDYKNRIVFSEVQAPERLVYRHAGETDEEAVHHETTTTFEDIGAGQTRVTMRLLFPSAEQLEFVVKNYGAEQGGIQTMERLGELVAVLHSVTREVTLTRRFDASREDVWRAWTDAAIVRQWWGPARIHYVCLRGGSEARWKDADRDAWAGWAGVSDALRVSRGGLAGAIGVYQRAAG